MNEAKHTPGPWFYGDWLKNEPGEPDEAGWVEVWNIDAHGFKGLPFVACKHHDEIANARLIAAAPDLFDSHEPDREGPDFLDWVASRLVLHGDHPQADFIVCLRRRAEKARAAIAKATGQP